VTDALRKQVEQLTEALDRRTTIGQALGMLMERYQIGEDEAFSFLVRCSSHQNRKLYDIAADFVETRELPDEFAGPGLEDVS